MVTPLVYIVYYIICYYIIFWGGNAIFLIKERTIRESQKKKVRRR